MSQGDRRAPPRHPALGSPLRQLPAQNRGGRLLSASRRWFWLAAIITLALDLVTKAAIFAALGGGPPPDGRYAGEHMFWILPGAFRLICHYNPGGAFGMASGNLLLFLGAAAILIPGLVLMAYHTREPGAPLWSLGLVVGGAVGNFYDRLFHIGVRDFFEFVNPRTGEALWAVFNVADIGIVVGVVVFFVWSFADFFRRKRGGTAADAGETT